MIDFCQTLFEISEYVVDLLLAPINALIGKSLQPAEPSLLEELLGGRGTALLREALAPELTRVALLAVLAIATADLLLLIGGLIVHSYWRQDLNSI